MVKNKVVKRLLIIVLGIFLVGLIIYCIRTIPFWSYNAKHEQKIRIDNSKDIAVNSAYSRQEADAVLRLKMESEIDDIMSIFPFEKVRQTYQGYYSIINLNDGYRLFLFFNNQLQLHEWIYCEGFINRDEGIDEIQELVQYHDRTYKETSIPHNRLNTGADYQAFYFKDGFAVVLYGWIDRDEEKETSTAVKTTFYRYSDLYMNPLFSLDSNLAIVYICRVDRTRGTVPRPI